MHTTRVEVDGRGYYAWHNGDYSGDVQIFLVLTQLERESAAAKNCKTDDPMIAEIPFKLMEELVGEKYADEEMSKIEQMKGSEFLKKYISG